MIILLPAYGRTYETLDKAEADWIAGKDFKIFKGPYCSVRDFTMLSAMGHKVVLKAGKKNELSKILSSEADKFEDSFNNIFEV